MLGVTRPVLDWSARLHCLGIQHSHSLIPRLFFIHSLIPRLFFIHNLIPRLFFIHSLIPRLFSFTVSFPDYFHSQSHSQTVFHSHSLIPRLFFIHIVPFPDYFSALGGIRVRFFPLCAEKLSGYETSIHETTSCKQRASNTLTLLSS